MHLAEVTNTDIQYYQRGIRECRWRLQWSLICPDPREHVTQPDNWFVIVNHLNERGPEKRQTRNVNPDIRSFSPVPDLHTVTLQKLDSSYANLHQFEASIFSKSTKQGL
jgi:hypothetical protein